MRKIFQLPHKSIPLNANWSVKFEEDIVSCSRSDCPEEVFSQVRLLKGVTLVHLSATYQTPL